MIIPAFSAAALGVLSVAAICLTSYAIILAGDAWRNRHKAEYSGTPFFACRHIDRGEQGFRCLGTQLIRTPAGELIWVLSFWRHQFEFTYAKEK